MDWLVGTALAAENPSNLATVDTVDRLSGSLERGGLYTIVVVKVSLINDGPVTFLLQME